MKVVGLLSGGKDSCYNLCHCAKQGHEIVALATLAPPEGKDELDSYMYQTVGHDAVHLVAEALQLPLYRHVITGQPLQTGSSFGVQDGQSRSRDETEDLYELLVAVKRHHPDIEAVSVGAILSNYQRTRVETICARPELNLQVLAYLWQRDQSELLNEMVQADVRAVLIKVAGIGLDERDLGKSLAQMQPKLTKLNNLYGAHVCGEGGEYETLTLDCPLFKKRIQLDETEIVVDTDSGNVASVAYLRMTRASLVDKEGQQSSTLENVLVPPVLDTLGRRSLAAVQSAIAESSASGATSTSFVLPKLQPSSASKPGCRCRAKGKWVAFHDITADDSSLNSTEEAVQSAFVNLKNELSKHNLSLAHCQHINLCIQSQSDFKSINAIYQRQFSIEPPSRATVALPRQSTPIKLDGWAYDDGSRYDASSTSIQLTPGSRSHERQALHVQGLSYWASANIGPYSQAVLAASRMTIAGQIGLVPRDLSLPENEHVQYALSLQHARRIFDAVLNERSRGEKGWIEGGICWVASEDKVRGAKACWDGQCHNDEDDDDEDEAGPNWLFGSEGISHGASTSTQTPPRGRNPLPMLYAQVAEDALPRGAIVEWQLTGHDGRRRSSTSQPGDDDEDEDESTEATRPEVRNDQWSISLDGQHLLTAHHQSILCPTGQSSHGILSLGQGLDSDSDSRDASDAASPLPDAIVNRISQALSVKVFVDVSSETPSHATQAASIIFERLFGGSCDHSIVPTLGLWTGKGQDEMRRWPMAVVWHDTK